MSIDANQALTDANLKVKLEETFRPTLRGLNKMIVRDFARAYAKRQVVIDAGDYKEAFESFLVVLYNKTKGKFVGRLKLAAAVAATDDEKRLIDETLKTFFLKKASEQATLITQTNKKYIDEAVAHGLEVAANEARNGRQLANEEIALASAASLSRKLQAREQTILTSEVQLAAEKSKANEAAILAGIGASVVARSAKKAFVPKEWVAVGDEKVRPDHVEADGQVVDISEPFNVGGELMMEPRDESLGATAKNTINCRCAAVIDNDALAAVRASAHSAQLAESIGLTGLHGD